MAQYIHDNTDDEFTHFTKFRTLPSSKATGANGLLIGQSAAFFAVLTNLARAADAARHGA